ncbi:MAG: BglG family transcription antiterminator [Caldanaerobacter subterraneus]|nr:BglG family transcription antiterminator [Caldanaerobacter subterraneus]
MDKLNSRQLQILKKILFSSKLTVSDIEREFHVSRRTAYRDIAGIGEFVKKYNLTFVNTSEGFALNGDAAGIEKLRLDVIGYFPVDAEERRKMILSELLQLKEPVKLEYFSKKFKVTTATISYDLKELEKWLEKQGLTLVTKPGYGVYISGNENSFRRAIANFLYENFDTAELANFLQRGYLSKSGIERNIDLRLLNLIDYDTVSKIEKAILRLKQQIDYEIVESSYMALVVHLALAIKRLQEGETIQIGEETLQDLKKTEEYLFAKKLGEYLEEELNIDIPEDEIGYITIHLLAARYRSTAQNYTDSEIESIVKEIIKEASKVFEVDFSEDKLLEEGLQSHLAPALYRLEMGLDIRNPLLGDIKAKYPVLFEKSNKVCDVLRKKLKRDIPEDEVGYIAMHFGAALERKKETFRKYNILVVCASGIGTSRMLMSKLQMFPQLNVVEVASSVKLKELEKREDIDLIVSTIPLKLTSKKVVVVNPLLLEEDVEKLKKALNTDFILEYDLVPENKQREEGYVKKAEHIAKYGKRILELQDSLVFMEVEGENSAQIVEEILEYLKIQGGIEEFQKEEIKERLLQRESLGKIVLPNKGFVIYHCAVKSLKKPILAVAKIKNEVKMKNLIGSYENIETAFLMVAPEGDREGIEVLGDLSVSLIEREDFLDSINTSKSCEEIKERIGEVLLGKFYEEIKRTV